MEQTGNRIIAKNATMLYIRMFFTMAISFYTSRIVLMALGVSDYGIYNVVGGITVLLNVLIGALGNSTSRFLTYSLGKGDLENLKQTFITASWVHIGLAIIFFVVAETIGLWFINTQLVIPEGRMIAANWVYQSAVVSVIMGITQTPYSASVTSHERMAAFAYIEIFLALCKLGIAAIVIIYDGDHLVLYSILYAVVSIAFQCYYRFYCIRHFEECHIKRYFNRSLFKEMFQFSSWSMLGSVTLSFKNQGMSILINRFFGTILNAAAGVALQVIALLYVFTSNITIAFNPQITKSYAAKNYHRTNELIFLGTKFTSLVTIIATIPLIFNMEFLMSLWLKEVPVGAVVICQICLFENLSNSFNPFMSNAIYATGRIKHLNIILSLYYILSIIGCYFILKLTHSYVFGYLFGLLCSPASTILYMIILRKLLPYFSMRNFVKKIYLPMLCIATIAFLLCLVIKKCVSNNLLYLICSSILCALLVASLVYRFIFDAYIRDKIQLSVRKIFSK